MKKAIIGSLALAVTLNMANLKAEDNRTEERIGFGSGLVIGALAGGPAGAIIGAVSGVWLGDKVNEAQKADSLALKLDNKTVQVKQLKQRLQVADSQIDEARFLLQDQEIQQQRVTQQSSAVSSLKLDVMFRTNSSELESETLDKLVPVAMMLDAYPDFGIQLTGHGDILGSVDANRIVAEDRSIRVKQSLINAGIDSDRIHIVTRGKSQADADLEDLDGRALDRRVRIQFIEASHSNKPSVAQN